ncbi:MAG: carboxymuconolactone decarboxylase family protein [Verrucomicrobia bacterium]|nr:carboxymuconolactone decarboxylase family protein [Verrucomicrobiota bacterium]
MPTNRRLSLQKSKPPARYLKFQKDYPGVFKAYSALGSATQKAGPLNAKIRALAKLAIAVGARLEGAVHSHTRRALEAGCTAAEIHQIVLLATTTIGFPAMMSALSWVDDVLVRKK